MRGRQIREENNMFAVLSAIKAKVLSVVHNEDGADAIEYLLTVAVIAVAIVAAIASNAWAPMVDAIVTGVCHAISSLESNPRLQGPDFSGGMNDSHFHQGSSGSRRGIQRRGGSGSH
jgi:Flp pilus assembly pilin Flp